MWRSCPWSLRRGFCRFSVGIGRVWSFRRRLLPAARRTGAGTRRSSAAARPSYPWVVDVPAGPWFSASPSRPAVRHSVHVKPRRITRARGIDPGGWGVLRLRIRILRILKLRVLKFIKFKLSRIAAKFQQTLCRKHNNELLDKKSCDVNNSRFVNWSTVQHDYEQPYKVHESLQLHCFLQCQNLGPQLSTVPIQRLPQCNRLLVFCEFENFAVTSDAIKRIFTNFKNLVKFANFYEF